MVATVVLLGLLLAATVTDLLRRKIYNWTTYPGILAALGFSAAGSALMATTEVSRAQLERLGWIEVTESLIGLSAVGAVMLLCFVTFKIGGGDVKLIAMLGAFLGPQRGIEAMLWTFVLGGCVGLIVLIWRVGPVQLVARTFRQLLWTLRLGRWSPLTEDERAQLQSRLHLAPNALAAVLIVQFQLQDLVM